jgi:hypothetical protein
MTPWFSSIPFVILVSAVMANYPITSYQFVPSDDNPWSGAMVPVDSAISQPSYVRGWDSWSNIAAYQGIWPWAGHELGEDMVLAPGTAGTLSDFGFTIVNDAEIDARGNFNIQYRCSDFSGQTLFQDSLMIVLDQFPIHSHGGPDLAGATEYLPVWDTKYQINVYFLSGSHLIFRLQMSLALSRHR